MRLAVLPDTPGAGHGRGPGAADDAAGGAGEDDGIHAGDVDAFGDQPWGVAPAGTK
jgi:hypothetical protein